MSLALVHSRARAGVRAPPVRVEVHLSGGLPLTHIVGLPEAAVREARDRVRLREGALLQQRAPELILIVDAQAPLLRRPARGLRLGRERRALAKLQQRHQIDHHAQRQVRVALAALIKGAAR